MLTCQDEGQLNKLYEISCKLFLLFKLGFDVQANSDNKTQKIKLYSVRVLKRYLNEKSLTHNPVMARISKFSPQIFETYFRSMELLRGSAKKR